MSGKPKTSTKSKKPSVKRPPKAEPVAVPQPSALSKGQQARLIRRKAEIRIGKEAFASALEKTLVILRYVGNCKCGLMLTSRDRSRKTNTYVCPQCGKSNSQAAILAAAKKPNP